MKNHVLRPLFAAIFVVALILIARAVVVPDDFGVHDHRPDGKNFTFGFYRAGAVDDWKSFTVKYKGTQLCAECHDDEAEAHLSHLIGADLIRANLSGADLSKAHLKDAKLEYANLTGVNLNQADLSRAQMMEAQLYNADLSGANLEQVELINAQLFSSKLIGANLSQADLRGAKLSEANLSQANLEGADLYSTNMTRADLSGANLSLVHFSLANWSEANLNQANLTDAKLTAIINVPGQTTDYQEQPGHLPTAAELVTPHCISLKNKKLVLLGRHQNADMRFISPMVSRRHATIETDAQGRYILQDQNSTNGVFVNRQKVKDPVVLLNGCTIQIGPFTLLLVGEHLRLPSIGKHKKSGLKFKYNLAEKRLANLSGSNLYGANLTGVNLESIHFSGAIMPDGTIYQ